MAEPQPTRREVFRKAVYVAPMIVTLPAVLSFASAGSREDWHDRDKDKHKDKDKDKKRPRA
jgi:hypothetical protein